MPFLVGVGLSCWDCFSFFVLLCFMGLFFFFYPLKPGIVVLAQCPLPAMDALETAGIKKFPQS